MQCALSVPSTSSATHAASTPSEEAALRASLRQAHAEAEELTLVVENLSAKLAATSTEAAASVCAVTYAQAETAAVHSRCEERICAAAEENNARLAEYTSWATTANFEAEAVRRQADGTSGALLTANLSLTAARDS